MSLTQHERILEILSDYEWHSGEEFVFQYRLTKFASRIGEILSDKKRWPDIDIEFGWDGEWRKYRLKRKIVQAKLLDVKPNYNF